MLLAVDNGMIDQSPSIRDLSLATTYKSEELERQDNSRKAEADRVREDNGHLPSEDAEDGPEREPRYGEDVHFRRYRFCLAVANNLGGLGNEARDGAHGRAVTDHCRHIHYVLLQWVYIAVDFVASTPRLRSIHTMTGVTAIPCRKIDAKMMTKTVAQTVSIPVKSALPEA